MKTNVLTSVQQFEVLDRFLANALTPLYAESEAFMEWVAEILASTVKSRRKNAAEMMSACGAVLSGASDPVRLLFEAGLDRGQAFRFLSRVIDLHDRMLSAEIELARMPLDSTAAVATLHEVRLLLGDRPRLSPAISTARYWHDQAISWRNHIVWHYLRFLRKGAIRMNRISAGRVEEEPTYHDAYVTALNCTNRYRTSSGPLASILGRALKGTHRVAASHSLGLAAPGARVKSDMALQSTSLEDAVVAPRTDEALKSFSATAIGDAEDADPVTLRALVALSNISAVRAALMISDVSPVVALRAYGLGPLAES